MKKGAFLLLHPAEALAEAQNEYRKKERARYRTRSRNHAVRFREKPASISAERRVLRKTQKSPKPFTPMDYRPPS